MKKKNTKAAKGPDSQQFWGHLAEELPRADVEINGRLEKRQKFYRIFVWSALVLLPISLLGNVSAIPKLLEEAPEAVVPVSEVDSPTKAAAIRSVETWLGTTPSPLPGGRILSWDGVDVQAEPSITVNPDNNETVETQGLQLHTMTLVAPTGALYETTAQVGFSEVRGAQVIGTPTLIPRSPDDVTEWPNLQSWPTLATISPAETLKQAAEAWVKAYTSGDPAALRQAVGDSAVNHSYVPLVQAAPSDVTVDAAAAEKVEGTNQAPEKPGTVVARISFGVSWEGQKLDSSSLSTPPRLTYDVLIEKADTGSPVIVAWGGAGTGESLEPYGNAVVDRQIPADSLTGPIDLQNLNGSNNGK